MLHQVHEGTHNICDGNGCNKGQKRWYETRSGQQLLRLRNHFFAWSWCDSHWFSWCPVKSAHLVSQHVPTSTRNVSPGPGCFFSFLPCEHRYKHTEVKVSDASMPMRICALQCASDPVSCFKAPLSFSASNFSNSEADLCLPKSEPLQTSSQNICPNLRLLRRCWWLFLEEQPQWNF